MTALRDRDMDAQALAGLVSFFLFSSLFVISISRLLRAFCLHSFDSLHRFFHLKVVFHVCYSFYALMESIYAVTLVVYSRLTRWGYSLHLLASLASIFLFLMLIGMWGVLLHDLRKTVVVGVMLGTMSTVSVVWAIVDVNLSGVEDALVSSNPSYLAVLCASSFSRFSLCLLILGYGHSLQQTLKVSSKLVESMTQDEVSIKLLLLRRIKIVVGVFTTCYFCRVFFLVLLILRDNSDSGFTGSVLSMPPMVWYLVSWWVPSVLPNIIFLEMMKMPPAEASKKKTLADGTVVVNKMFREYATEDDGNYDMESYVFRDSQRSERMISKDLDMQPSSLTSNTNNTLSTRNTSRDVEMHPSSLSSRVISTDSTPRKGSDNSRWS